MRSECIVLHPAGDTNPLYQTLDDNVCGLNFLGGSGTASAVEPESASEQSGAELIT
jgi:hypothetical protein